MIRYIKLIFQVPVLIFDIILFKIFKKKNTETSYQAILSLFCVSGGFSNTFINKILGKKNKNIESNSDTELFYKNGYICYKDYYSPEFIKNFRNELKSLKGFWRGDNCINTSTVSTKKNLNKVEKENFNGDNIKSTRYDYLPKDLITLKSVQKILLDEKIYKMAQNYLGNEPILSNIACWHSFPTQYSDYEAAQLWHFDYDTVKFIKFFIYLDNCSSLNGPHCFIQGSHKNKGIPWEIRKKGYKRIADEEVNKYYDNNKIIEFAADEGTLLIENTAGLHKGKRVLEGKRLLFNLEFVSSMFGGYYSTDYGKIKLNENLIDKKLLGKFRSNTFTYQMFN